MSSVTVEATRVVVPCRRWVWMPLRISSTVPEVKEAPPPPWLWMSTKPGTSVVAGEVDQPGVALRGLGGDAGAGDGESAVGHGAGGENHGGAGEHQGGSGRRGLRVVCGWSRPAAQPHVGAVPRPWGGCHQAVTSMPSVVVEEIPGQ